VLKQNRPGGPNHCSSSSSKANSPLRSLIVLCSFIMDSYKGPGLSRVWLFGLSRGAYTVRAVAGMINNCGILKAAAAGEGNERRASLQRVWQMYRR
jgi:uncharacterized protein (DUF2235 family)